MDTVAEAARKEATGAATQAFGWRWEGDGIVATDGTKGDGHRCPGCGEEPLNTGRADGKCRCEREVWWDTYLRYYAEHGHATAPDRWAQATTVPPRYVNARFSNFRRRPGTETGLAVSQKWAGSFNRRATNGLLLVGPFGSGKTHLAVASAYAAVERDAVIPRFVSASTLAHEVKKGEQLDMEPVNQACRAPLLILDDIGQTGRTPFDREIIYRVVSERYEAQRPMIATSNLTEKVLAETLGGALVSRLYECTRMAALTASDYRKESGR